MNFLHIVQPADVTNAETFAAYAHQTIGTSRPRNGGEWSRLGLACREFFEQNPQATWRTLANTVDWLRAKRKRIVQPWQVVGSVRWAFADGALPELDPTRTPLVEKGVEFAIARALEVETDDYWRRMLIGSQGVNYRRLALDGWTKHWAEMRLV